jgi:hypothetical protein
MNEPITDINNRLLGYYFTLGENQYIKNKSGNSLGYYSPAFNKTFKMNGSPVANGNVLISLLLG